MGRVTDATGRPADLSDQLATADGALVRTVDGLDDAAHAGDSLLPGWTRAHVVAHLALNAEALAGVLHGAHLGQPQPMYATAEERDTDIAELAAAGPTALRDRFLGGTGRFGEALAAMADGDWDGTFERSPGGPEYSVADVALMRLREVEIHHADLDAGYTAADWPEPFRRILLRSMEKRSYPAPFSVSPTDLGETWHYGAGDGGPVVTGTSSALGWWLTGRGTGEGLTTDANVLPEVESW